jgi:hypothetical protein
MIFFFVILIILFSKSLTTGFNTNSAEREIFHNNFKKTLLNKFGINESTNEFDNNFEDSKHQHDSFMLEIEVKNLYDRHLNKLFGKFNRPYNIIRSFSGE